MRRAPRWRWLASLLVVGSIALVGLGTGVAASTGTATAPVGSGALTEDVTESTLVTSTHRRSSRRLSARPIRRSGACATSGPITAVETLLARWLRLALPSWRGPPVLLV